MANKAKQEPFLTSEKIVNDDGTPSDYLVRYLNRVAASGASSVTFPVTSVNGKTGDVVITFEDIVQAGGIDYDKLNEKLQELISGLSTVPSQIQTAINNLKQEDDPFGQYAFRTGFDYDIDQYLFYPPDDPLNDNGFDGYFIPHYTSETAQQAYSLGAYMTQANKSMIHCCLFAVPRKFITSSIGFCVYGNTTNNDASNAKQQWKIGIYTCGKKLLTNTESAPRIGNEQWMRFPAQKKWESNLMDTSKKFDSVTFANTTYLNDDYYTEVMPTYTQATPYIKSNDIVEFERGVYFVVIARTNSSVSPSYANELKSTMRWTDDSENQSQGNFINIFPSFKDTYWKCTGPGTSGAFGNIQKITNFIITGISSYLTLPTNLLDTYQNVNFVKAGASTTTNNFTDPLDNTKTTCTMDIGLTIQSAIGAPIFTGRFV